MQIQPYLFFNGDCEAAFNFYERCLGGKIEAMLTHAGTPAEQQVPSEWRSKILHARLAVGDAVLIASDAPPGHYQKPQGFETLASLGPADDCIVDKIDEFTAELESPATSDPERRLALQFLLHFVGDVHQPLHAGDDHARDGGSDSI
jgi:uncharacterized glyoxalase superfamily protein PhnB